MMVVFIYSAKIQKKNVYMQKKSRKVAFHRDFDA